MYFSPSFFFHSKKQPDLAESLPGKSVLVIRQWTTTVFSGLLPYAQINACFRSSLQCSSFNLILSSYKMKAFSWAMG